MSDVVRLEQVSLSRGGQPILRAVDWTVRDGERWAVLGPNGAGKTTLLEIASLYLFPSSGRVTVLGAVHGRSDIRPLRSRIGYASAALARLLHRDSTALEAVATGRTGVLDPYWAAPSEEDVAAARRLLERLGAVDLADHPLGTLSEGERQRVQIARALMAAPDLLVLDEPSAGLDLGSREVLVSSLAGLAADPLVRAIVFVTHHVEEIPPGFSHALLLRAGRVVAAGPIAETLTPATLSACFGLALSLTVTGGRWMARATGPAAVGIEAAGSHAAGAGDAATGPRRPTAEPEHEGSGRRGDPGDRDGAVETRHGLLRDPDGRLKAYRPLAPRARLEALTRALDAYVAGEFFAAHEILEPAWMGTDDQSERALYQGLIKVAAAGVHATRGNARGVLRNLEGASVRLARAPDAADGILGEALALVDLQAVRAWVAVATTVVADALDPGRGGRGRTPLAGGDDGTCGPVRAGDGADAARLLALSPAPVRGSVGRPPGRDGERGGPGTVGRG